MANSYVNGSNMLELKNERFLTKKVFLRMSENMHYELFKYLNYKELIMLRGTNLGGYQLVTNPILRSRIKNYYIRNPYLTLEELIDIEYSGKKVELMYEQTGREAFNLEKMNITDEECIQLSDIFKYIPKLQGINLRKLIFIVYSFIHF